MPEFNHDTETRYPLRGMHQNVACASCHLQKVFANVGRQCQDCHADLHRRQFGAACQDCHSVQGWKSGVQTIRDHQNRFPLLGAHAVAPCESCHRGAASAVFTGLSTECVACHRADYDRARSLNHRAANLPVACALCHSMDSWARARFDHNQFTRFPLRGAHAQMACSACHAGGNFTSTPTACFDCHAKDFAAAKNPDHVQAGFPRDCLTCHTDLSWSGAKFDHNALTRFALDGAHVSVQCASCHLNGRFAGTPSNCYACHSADFEKAGNPNHVTGRFATTCETCHTTTAWQGAKFDHNLSRFPLTGAHAPVACAGCHVGGKFTGTASDCGSCHLSQFQLAKNPNHTAAGFSQDCSTCHTTISWNGAQFDHAKTRFALVGAHAKTACAECHINDRFAGLPATCDSCHLADYQRAANPNHAAAGLPRDCSICHGMVQWSGAAFDHNSQTHFALTGKHAAVQCSQCHAGNRFAGTPAQCSGCHQIDFQKTTSPNHVAAAFAINCESCHTTAAWKPASYDHNQTRFPLTGRHTTVDCASCHTGGKFSGISLQCSGCHLAAFQSAVNPNHAASGFPTTCETCHTTTAWRPANFDHDRTRFPLTGKHTSVTCDSCHIGGKFTGTSTQCAGCHLPDFQKTTNPNHTTAGFPTTCDTCHTTTAWRPANFDHNRTKFPLTGKHTSVTCDSCHIGGKYTGTATQCSGCHLPDFQKTTNPNHTTAGFPTTCDTCHTTTAWRPANFDHNRTKFPLTGKHTSVTCDSCHIGGKYTGTATQCSGCHLPDFQKTTNPNHTTAGFPTTCDTCHTTTAWRPANFDHNRTKFPLTGKHTSVTCDSCHIGGKFTGTATQCSGCHLPDFQKTTNPNHTTAGFPTTCDTCHTTTAWRPASFDHNRTKFPLTGKHTSVTCDSCHIGGKFTGTAAQCSGCHLPDFQKTTNPNHTTAGFPTTCDTCHTTTAWRPASFDHNRTKFPLTGKHTSVTCDSCHIGGKFTGTATQCSGCHLPDFQKTTNPNHTTAGFPTTCDTCHTTTAWRPASFDHNRTKFPLTGKHTSVTCDSCHIGGKYTGTATQCSGCHLPDFQKTTNPNHTTAGFPTTCDTCHTTTAWRPASFDHNRTKFPLTGKHTSVTCDSCHIGGKYTGTATQCSGCHLPDFQKTTNPNHTTAGFPTTCDTCHTTTAWRPANFDHNRTKFPLTGKHTSVTCDSCHIGGKYTGTATQCSGCHLPDFQKTTNPNHTTAGFPTTCDTCHTTTAWRPATFDHSRTRFPLTGKHISTPCVSCHVNGVYTGTSMQCSSCHLATFQKTTNPNHTAAGFPTTCDTCHTTAGWTPATFDHNTRTRFALTGKHTTVQCAACHVGGKFAGTPTVCSGCHLAKYQQTTNPNHVAAGFPTTCDTCHTTAGWTPATFDHNKTRFPLSGKHTTVLCASCHVGGKFTGTPTTCASCHLAKYQQTKSPNHVSAGFPQDCSLCHTTAGWTPAAFDHNTRTRFPLTGKHTTLQCTQCHLNNVFAGTPTLCSGCHLAKYQQTKSPNHTSAGFPTTCDTCHTTTAWTPASFNHNNTKFPLTGRHASVQCALCHVNNVFAGTPTACYSCHSKEYTTVTNPNHVAAGFPKTCDACHNTTAWTGATFNHKFPIYSGTHKGKWQTCNDCHTNPSNYTIFSCTNCHEHAQASMDSKHRNVRGYVYNSTNCYSCHPQGRGG